MTLGEKIYGLRNERHMSQGDLAEHINVSRQSVSKWETGASAPDLDKLILLSELFCVTLDELVKDGAENPAQPAAAQPAGGTQNAPRRGRDTQRGVGFVLLGVGLLSAVLGLLFGLLLLILAALLLLSGVLCLTEVRHVGLIMGWLTFLPVALSLPSFTSASMRVIFSPYYYQEGLVIQLTIAWTMWALLFALLFYTARAVLAWRRAQDAQRRSTDSE